MKLRFNQLISTNQATVFLFLYGLITQIVAFPVIYFFSAAVKVKTSVIESLIFIWFCIPIIAVFSIVIAIIQIKAKKIRNETFKAPLIGLILNVIWLLCYLVALYMVFEAEWFFA